MTGPSIAQLGIRVNSEEADQASDALDKLVQSGARTAQEMAALNLKQREAAKSAVGSCSRSLPSPWRTCASLSVSAHQPEWAACTSSSGNCRLTWKSNSVGL